MIFYLDSSAVVKRYVAEPSSEKVRTLLSNAQEIVTSVVAYPEVISAIHRKRREGQLTSSLEKRLLSIFKKDWEGIFKVNVSVDITFLAGKLITQHSLRAFDAIHIASALVTKKKIKEDIAFLSFDGQQNKAALSERLFLGDV